MAQITINIPDQVLGRVVDGLCGRYSYDDRKQEGETKGQFAKRTMMEWVKSSVKKYEQQKASVQAEIDAAASVDADIVLS